VGDHLRSDAPDAAPRLALRTSIVTRQTLFVALLVIFTGAALTLTGYLFVENLIHKQVDERLELAASDRRAMLAGYIDNQLERLSLFASRTHLRRLLGEFETSAITPEEFRSQTLRILNDARSSSRQILSIAIANKVGRVVASTDAAEIDEDSSTKLHFLAGSKGRYFGEPYHAAGRDCAVISGPACDEQGTPLGVVFLRIDIAPVMELLRNHAGMGDTGEVVVAAGKGDKLRLLFVQERDRSVGDLPPRAAPALAQAVAGRTGAMQTRDYRGVAVLAAYRPVGYRDWGMAAKMSAAEAYAPLADLRRLLVVVFALVLLLGVAASYFIACQAARPILQLTDAAARIAGGDLYVRVENTSRDEVGVLARSFNDMATQLANYYGTLENRVLARTIELEHSKNKLEAEMAERLQAEAAVEHERNLLHAFLDNYPGSIYFKDLEGRFIRINRGLADHLGLRDPGEAIGKTDFNFFTPEHAGPAFADEQDIIHTGKPIVGKEEKETLLDGSERWVSTTKMPLRDRSGYLVGTMGMSRDIDARKRDQEALRVAKDAAESANRAKSDFLANMSHEIRTPMNAILVLTELVLDTQLEPAQRESLTLVHESAESLLQLLNDILDFSKIEAGKLEIEASPFALRESLGDTLKVLATRAHRKNLELACHIHPDVPEALIGDPYRLRQVVVNLVGNAIKFTEVGEVVVTVVVEAIVGDVVLRFSVTDTGIGISRDKQDLIFEAFSQADTSTTRRFGGTGLGLAICKRLVELMGGDIWVDSELNRGSTFSFTAHFRPAPTAAIERYLRRPADIRGKRVLVVDDNDTNRRIIHEMLGNWGMAPTVSAGGDEAITLLHRAVQEGKPFDLVVTDSNMPAMDGFTLARSIKSDPRLDSTIVMMLTSGDRTGDIALCDRIGVAAYLLKPVKQSDLFDAIAKALGMAELCDQSLAPEPVGQELPPLRVLLAEDSLVNQKLATQLLQKYGHRVQIAGTGKEALAALKTDQFDLVLMDVQMPEMDGLEATRSIRRSEARTGGHIPIVAMTAHAMKGDRESCLDAGMDGYVAKPIRTAELFATIKEVLHKGPAQKTCATFLSIPSGQGVCVDWDVALSAVGADRRILGGIVSTALTELPELLADLRTAVASGNCEAIHRLGHTLKGSLDLFGARSARQPAYELETKGRNRDLADVEHLFSTLNNEVEQVLSELAMAETQ